MSINLNSNNVQISNFGNNSFSITNTGDKDIAKVEIDVTNALYPDSVFDPFGLAGDTATKALTINTNGGTGVIAPSNASYIGLGGAQGFEGIQLLFDPTVNGGFDPGETLGFSVDMDPNSVAGTGKAPLDGGSSPPWDVGGVSGAELIGSTFIVTFTDGTTATGQLQGAGNQGGSKGLASQDFANVPVVLTANGFGAGEIGQYGSGGPSIIVSGPAGETARVVLTKGFIQPIDPYNSPLASQLNALAASGFPANNAVEFQTVDIVLTGSEQDITDEFDFSGVDGFNFSADPNFPLSLDEDKLPLGLVASIIDINNSDLPKGPVTQPIYLQFDEDFGVNAPPTAVNDDFITAENSNLSGSVFANNGNGVDSDPNGDTFTVTAVNGLDNVGQSVTLASGALLTLNGDGTFSYNPNSQFDALNTNETGSDSFSYTISDSNGATDTAIASITITGIDTPSNGDDPHDGENPGNGEDPNDGGSNNPPPIIKQPFLSFESLVTVATAQGLAIPYAPVEVGGLNLGQFFDSGFYLNQNPDVFAAVVNGTFTTPFEHFVQFGWLEGRNGSLLFNEQEYLNTYGDVAAAVGQGDFRSGFQHFALFGHLEDRDPSSLFSQSDYLTNNPDVKAAVDRGDFGSGFEHYIEFGALEGREPELSLYQEDFYLANNLDVKAAVEQGGFTSGFEHFARFGIRENRQPSDLYSESAYLAANPDVDAAVSAGQLPSGLVHYAIFGAAEGRALA